MNSTSLWYYARDKRRVGPLPWDELLALVRSGQLHPTDMILEQGADKWQSAQTVPGLFAEGPESTAAPAGLPPEVVAAQQLPAAAAPSYPEIPGYEILLELGRGGMGVVYQARQIRLKRFVALKMILSGAHAGADELARFKAEAQAVAQLQHPNIVAIHEIGDKDGLPYFSLEFVEGGSLAQQLTGTPLPLRQAAALTETLARAVHHAHQRCIIHRDLKPANILLAPQRGAGTREPPAGAIDLLATSASDAPARGSRIPAHRLGECVPKITDFGLAKQLTEDSRTQTGVVMGTPAYMAPEQAEGRVTDIGPWTDIYALGAILYEFLTGQPLFSGKTAWDVLRHVREDEPTAPHKLHKQIPRDLETICLKCLEKAPARRYLTAEELAEDLRRFLAHEPIHARPVGRVGRAYRWCRRHTALSAALGLGVLAAVAVLVLLLSLRSAGLRGDQAQQKRQQQEELEAREFGRNLDIMTGQLEVFSERLQTMTDDDWKQISKQRPGTIKRLIAAWEALGDVLHKAKGL
jgi:serine/threonine protein kinase